MVQVNLRLSVELLAKVDGARGDVSRNRWLVRAVEQALGDGPERAGSDPVAVAVSLVAENARVRLPPPGRTMSAIELAEARRQASALAARARPTK